DTGDRFGGPELPEDPKPDRLTEKVGDVNAYGLEMLTLKKIGVGLRGILSPLPTAHPGATRGVQALGGSCVNNKTNAIPCSLHILFRF
ncbi:unnamed protein product, partial [marine sediment metagenome]